MSTSGKAVCGRALRFELAWSVRACARALSAGAPLHSKSSEAASLQMRYDSQDLRAGLLERVRACVRAPV